MDGPPPPPPPPHGANPKPSHGSGLPPGNYDIFIIPPHSSGGGFLYLPSLQPHRNSFLAGVACTLLAVGVWTIVEPVVKQWFATTMANMSGGGGGIVLLVIGVGIAGWAMGKTQNEHPSGSNGDGSRGDATGGASSGPGAGARSHSGGYQRKANGYDGGGAPPQNPGGGSGYGPPPNTQQHQRQHEQWPPPPPRPPSPPFSEPDATPKSPPRPESTRSSSANWERAREATRKREEERKRQAEERKQQDEDERKRKEAEQAAKAAEEKKKWETARAREKEAAARAQRERDAQERLKKIREEQEAKEKEAREKLEREIREKVEAEAAAAKAREDAERAKAEAEKAAKAKTDAERAERLKAVRERAEKAKAEREARAKAAASASEKASQDASGAAPKPPPTSPPSTKSTRTYGVGERTDPYAPDPPSPTKKPYEKPTVKSYLGTDINSSYDTPKRPAQAKSTSSFSTASYSSYAPSATTARTTPPPSQRGPYSTTDPDKIVIKAVYLFSSLFPKPVAELVAGVDRVTDGLILRMTTEGLFIDDDVRDVAQREWDVKAWTVKAVEVYCPRAPAGLLPSGNPDGGAKEHMAGLKFFSGQTGGHGAPGKLSPEDTDLAVEKLLRSCKGSCGAGAGVRGRDGLHVLRASIKDQEGRKYVFLVDESEGWKVAMGLQRMRRGSMVRGMAVMGLPAMEVRRLTAFWTPS